MTNSTLTDLFTFLGFTPEETALYVALLESGPTSIRRIAAAAGVNRGKAYESLKHLVDRGLVSYKRTGAQNRFTAESPDKLYDLIHDRKQELEQSEQIATSLLPTLMARSKRRAGEPIVRFYEEDEGIATILRDVLTTLRRSGQKEYRTYSSQSLRQYLYKRFPTFTARRIAEGIAVRVIAIGHQGDPATLSERRWLPSPEGQLSSSYTIIYADKVAMISLSENQTPYGVVIEEPGVAVTQRLLFDSLWQILPAPPVNP